MNPPELIGDFGRDRVVVVGCLSELDERIAELPEPACRDHTQRARAAEAHQAARRIRAEFMRLHAEPVYEELTRGWTARPRLSELVLVAAEMFPGLVPSAAQLAAESRRVQADKEGREIDQGIFAHALLSSPRVGAHLLESMLRPTARALRLREVFHRTGEVVLDAARLERRGPAGHITITNLHCLNAEDNRHVADMETVVDLVLLDPEVRVGVVRGAVMTHPRYAGRRVFSAGINLKELRAGNIGLIEFLLEREMGYISKLLRGVSTPDAAWPWGTVQKPWLAAVDGFAIGGGAQLLLAFDRVIAASDAYFSLPAAREGIVPGVSNLRLTRFLGARPARRVILSGDRVGAGEPAAGLVFDQVVDPAEMDEAIESAVSQLDNPAVAANRRMLNLAEEPVEDFRRYLAEFALLQAIRAYSPDVVAK